MIRIMEYSLLLLVILATSSGMEDSSDITSAQQCNSIVVSDFPNKYFNPEFIANNSDDFSTAASFVRSSHNFTLSLDIFSSLCNGIALKCCYETNIENETDLFEFSLMSLADETINVSTVLRARDQVDNCFAEFCCDEMPLSNISFSFYDTLNVTVRITILSGSLLQLNEDQASQYNMTLDDINTTLCNMTLDDIELYNTTLCNMTLDDVELYNVTLYNTTHDQFGMPLHVLVGLIIGSNISSQIPVSATTFITSRASVRATNSHSATISQITGSTTTLISLHTLYSTISQSPTVLASNVITSHSASNSTISQKYVSTSTLDILQSPVSASSSITAQSTISTTKWITSQTIVSATSIPKTPEISKAVGWAVSVPIVVIIMAVATVVVVVLVFKYRIKRNRVRTTKNVSYGGGNVHCEEYAGNGPQVSSVQEPEYAIIEDTLEPYAECDATYNKLREEDEKAYILPAKGEEALYAQLEDTRTDYLHMNSVRLSNVLGSGQFGVVYRGVLVNDEGEEVEVAVKTLKEGSGEEDRVKFLQEAAIIGQFKHNNVVTMYGVVTQGEPILLVLELLPKGDLTNHLIHYELGRGWRGCEC